MYELCTDIGYVTLTKTGEQLCGDHVELVQQAADRRGVSLKLNKKPKKG